jgi:predicted transposase YdaD
MELVYEASSLIKERLASAPENLDKLKTRFKVKKWAYLRLEPRLQDLNSRLDGVIQSLRTALNAISA